jgi:hypothetical protein
MFTWSRVRWRYKALAISFAANSLVAASIFVFGYLTAWLLIPGAYASFWMCNLLDPGCKDWHENAAWVFGWFVNTVVFWE